MTLYGEPALSADALWDLCSAVAATPSIWSPETFSSSARACGPKRVRERRRHFSFHGPANLRGQAPVTEGWVEELRLFVGEAPRDVDEATWRREDRKISVLAERYARRFRAELGSSRTQWGNEVFEHGGHRVRVLPTQCVWVVVSSLAVVGRLNDYWPESEA